MKRRLKRCLELLTRIKRLPLSKYADIWSIVKCRFYGLKRLLLRKKHHQTTKPMFLLQKNRLERYLELVTGILRKPLLKYAYFLTIEKCRFYRLISLLLIDEHYQTTKPRSLLQKRRVKGYLELLTRIMRNPLLKYANFSTILTFCFYGLKRLLSRKKTSSNDKTDVSLTEK